MLGRIHKERDVWHECVWGWTDGKERKKERNVKLKSRRLA